MANALGIFGVLFGLSMLEGMWTWLLVASISEVATQNPPALLFFSVVLLAAWLLGRVLALANLELERRRTILLIGGLGLALAVGTVHAGLLHPLQLIFGQFTPDLRGAGIAALVAVVYLWGRGLALLGPTTRERVLHHVGSSAAGLAAVLVILPLTETVREQGLTLVVASFVVGVGCLLLVRLAGVESRQLTRLQWTGVGAGAILLLIVAAAMVTGTFSSGGLALFGQGLAEASRAVSPFTNVVLLAAGYFAQYLNYLFRWLSEVFGSDPEAIQRGVENAEATRPEFDPDPGSPPELLAMLVAVFVTFMFIAVVVLIYRRLIRRAVNGSDEEIEEVRGSIGGGGLAALLRGVLGECSMEF